MSRKDKLISELISKVLDEYIFEAEEPKEAGGGNPFAAGGGDAGADAGGAAAGGAEGEEAEAAGGEEEKEKDKKPAEEKGLSFNFDVSAVKKYNTANFRNSKATAKKITKNGILATVEPDGVDVLIGFDDITENIKKFFKSIK